jgi:cystathionine beta-lyase/cystathionine gamma-synthase
MVAFGGVSFPHTLCYTGVGAVPSPFDCYMTNRGMKTLHIRMERHASNAMAVAEVLEAHPFVEKVLYPGLPSHPQHEIAKKQCTGFGGMITFYIKVPRAAHLCAGPCTTCPHRCLPDTMLRSRFGRAC